MMRRLKLAAGRFFAGLFLAYSFAAIALFAWASFWLGLNPVI